MSKKESDSEKKLKEGKKAASAAVKMKAKNKIASEAKKLGEKAAMEIASNLPAGEGNAFIKTFAEYGKAVEVRRVAAKNVSNVRAKLKAMKVDMSCFDRVFKLSEMDAQDVAAKKATEALYENQLSMELSDDQKVIVENINKNRDAARATDQGQATNTGKEVGSATNASVQADASLPAANEALGKSFRPLPAVNTH